MPAKQRNSRGEGLRKSPCHKRAQNPFNRAPPDRKKSDAVPKQLGSNKEDKIGQVF
jgi:hypothetical protein